MAVEMTPAARVGRMRDPKAGPNDGVMEHRAYENVRGQMLFVGVPLDPSDLPVFRGKGKAKVNINIPAMPGMSNVVEVEFDFPIPVPAEPWRAIRGRSDVTPDHARHVALQEMIRAAFSAYDAEAQKEAGSEELKREAYREFIAQQPPSVAAQLDKQLTDATGRALPGTGVSGKGGAGRRIINPGKK